MLDRTEKSYDRKEKSYDQTDKQYHPLDKYDRSGTDRYDRSGVEKYELDASMGEMERYEQENRDLRLRVSRLESGIPNVCILT